MTVPAPRRRPRQGDTVDAAEVRGTQSEAGFQKAVCELLDLYHWHWHHEQDSRKSKRGLPDLIALRRRRLIFAELKSTKGRLTDDQADWLYRLGQHGGVECYVWFPNDMDEVERVLR